ncbi:hypothetical protein [Aequorivita echinoideorum]|nr:hypothetical protein [Aequorivita echinoideorum]
MQNAPAGKREAVIAYAPFVGFFIAFFMNSEKKHPFATWHIKNMFGIFLMFMVSVVIQSQINYLIGDILWTVVLLIWLFCWLMAILNKRGGIPLLSEKFQEWFTFLN